MLVLTRRFGEVIYIGDSRIKVLDSKGGKVRIGIEADKSVKVLRAELKEAAK